MTKTSNYQLNQWDPTDRVLRTDFNSDNTKIDDALSQMQNTLSHKGNCRLYIGTYTGTGTHGSGGASSYTFPQKPLIVFLADPIDSYKMLVAYGQATGFSEVRVATGNTLTWEGNTLSWYNSSTSTEQMNMLDRVYHVYALMDADADTV